MQPLVHAMRTSDMDVCLMLMSPSWPATMPSWSDLIEKKFIYLILDYIVLLCPIVHVMSIPPPSFPHMPTFCTCSPSSLYICLLFLLSYASFGQEFLAHGSFSLGKLVGHVSIFRRLPPPPQAPLYINCRYLLCMSSTFKEQLAINGHCCTYTYFKMKI